MTGEQIRWGLEKPNVDEGTKLHWCVWNVP